MVAPVNVLGAILGVPILIFLAVAYDKAAEAAPTRTYKSGNTRKPSICTHRTNAKSVIKDSAQDALSLKTVSYTHLTLPTNREV